MRRARVCSSFWDGSWGARLGSGCPGPALCASCQILCPAQPHIYLSSSGQVEGRLGPSTVVLDHTGGFEGLLLVDDDLLGVSEDKARGPRSKPLLTAPNSS